MHDEAPVTGDPHADEAAAAAALARRIGGGEAAAEEELVVRYSRGVRFVLRRLTGSPERAEDLHQETFRIVLERLREGRIDDPERVVGFLHGTARRLALGASRRAARRRTDTASDALPDARDPTPGPLDATLRGERARLVRRLLVDLRPPRDREILTRFYLAEEPKERLCAAFDLSAAHFDRVLYRAKKRFRALLENTALMAAAAPAPGQQASTVGER